TPNTPNREGKSSQREHPHGRHQTIILPCVGANLPNGHKGTRVSSGYTARGGGRVRVSQVHGHNQFLSSEIFASHEPQCAAGILPAENAWLCRRDVGSTFLGRTARVAKVHGPNARPMLEVEALP